MAEHPRIEELRRRVLKDKASIAFAQLAEEYRRAGRFDEAIDTCRTGLSHHPGYLSAHVTLGRALIEVGQLQPAQDELQRVLSAAPENLAALKGLAEIHQRRGEQPEALEYYRRALELAPHDPDLEHLVGQIARELESSAPPVPLADGLSFEEAMGEFLALDRQEVPPPALAVEPPSWPEPEAAAPAVDPATVCVEPADPEPPTSAFEVPPAAPVVSLVETSVLPTDGSPSSDGEQVPTPAPSEPETPSPARATMQVEALERWLDAILADRQKGQPHTDGQA